MKRIFLFAFLVVLLAVPMFSASNTGHSRNLMVSLNGVATTGAGDDFRIFDSGANFLGFGDITWQTVYTGTPTAITVNLEGSIDGTNWFTLDTSTQTTNEMRHVVNKRVEYLRCNISAYTVNSSTATCSFRSYK